ncbi:MAG: putative flap endonuclease-1-like 5' DNA nuclease [Halovenus sp.]|jgi:predicted flap endonuclease-1-like 5' DNA nuclease
MPVKFIAEVVKGLFGISDSETTDAETETNITVERETGDGAGADDNGSVESEPAETKRVEESEEAVVENGETDDTQTEPETDDTQTEPETDDTQTEPETDDESVDEVAESVEAVTGIGPTYGERLADAGIGTVAELAETEPDEVAEVAEVSESRATDFVRKARER